MEQVKPATIDAYIEGFPQDIQEKLQELRRAVHQAAPDATEAMSYGMPTFKLHGNLVHFAAYKHHIGFYPASSDIAAFQEDLSVYKNSKGAVQFPLTEPLPLDLIKRMTSFRVKASLEAAALKKMKK